MSEAKRLRVAMFVLVALLAAACGNGGDGEGSDRAGVEASDTDEVASGHPTLDDHWHAAYGVYVCDQFLPPFASTNDPLGIHSHQDGLIHIHPFSQAVTGENATLGVFFDSMGASLSDDELDLDGTVLTSGDECDGEPAVLRVARWSDVGVTDVAPEVFTEGFADINYLNDREAYTIALVPAGAEVPPPPTIPNLDNLTDVPG